MATKKMNGENFNQEPKRRGRPKKSETTTETLTGKTAVVYKAPKKQKAAKIVPLTTAKRRDFTTEQTGVTPIEKTGVKNAMTFYKSTDCPESLISSTARRYRQVQDSRIAVGNQRSAILRDLAKQIADDRGIEVDKLEITEAEMMELHPELAALNVDMMLAENYEESLSKMLDAVTARNMLAQWMRQIVGVGPTIAALIVGEIGDIGRFEYPTRLIAYAGLDPTKTWYGTTEAAKLVDTALEGSKEITDDVLLRLATMTGRRFTKLESMTHPIDVNKVVDTSVRSITALKKNLAKPWFNKNLKRNLHILAESIAKQKHNPKSLYSSLYFNFLAEEQRKNELGLLKKAAEDALAKKTYSKDTVAYQQYIQGKLPPMHLVMRAQRRLKTIFMCHVFEAGYYFRFGKEAPGHYVFEHMGHKDYLAPEVDYHNFQLG